jgi:hypothetical protein
MAVFRWQICFASATLALVLAQGQEQLDESAHAANASKACELGIIWPASDSVVLFATDTRESMIYVKLSGDCSQFLRPKHHGSQEMRLHFVFLYYYTSGSSRSNRDAAAFEWGYAAPLDTDATPVHYREMRSPFLARSNRERLRFATSGHDVSKDFSVWCFTLIHPQTILNRFGAINDAFDQDELLMFEPHLLSNPATPASSVPVSSDTVKFRALGKPSSHLHTVTARYIT